MSDEDAEGPEIKRIEERARRLLQAAFGSGADYYYLSQLGNELGEDRLALEGLGYKLSDFINRRLGFKLGRVGVNNNIVVALPPSSEEGKIQIRPAMPRYSRSFWAAFSMPLRGGERRYINIETHEFGPEKEKLGPEQDVWEIEPRFIRGTAEVALDNSEIYQRIDDWLRSAGLDGKNFFIRKLQRTNSGDSLLDQVISVLDNDQLSRVVLPLDVVAILRRKR